MNPIPIKRIPYGLADYGRMREDNSYYVDKLRLIMFVAAPADYHLLLFGCVAT